MSLARFTKNRDALLTLPPSTKVVHAIQEMIEDRSGAALVVDEDSILLGIFTERDVMSEIVIKKRDPENITLKDVMVSEVIKITLDESLDAAIHCMQAHQISHLPIVENGNTVVGMITLRHLLHDKIKDLVEELHSLEAYLNDAPGG